MNGTKTYIYHINVSHVTEHFPSICKNTKKKYVSKLVWALLFLHFFYTRYILLGMNEKLCKVRVVTQSENIYIWACRIRTKKGAIREKQRKNTIYIKEYKFPDECLNTQRILTFLSYSFAKINFNYLSVIIK